MANKKLTHETVEELLKNNPELAKALITAASEKEADQLLKENGYDFTADDLNDFMSERELSENELGKVGGGSFLDSLLNFFR